jgi:hypothetical protein
MGILLLREFEYTAVATSTTGCKTDTEELDNRVTSNSTSHSVVQFFYYSICFTTC